MKAGFDVFPFSVNPTDNAADNATIRGMIADIQRFSLDDGPGIRTTVFLKGCHLRCAWCHNPETISREPELLFYQEKCIGCRACEKVCPSGCHQFDGEKCIHILDRNACVASGKCARQCPGGALRIVGRSMSVEEVLEEIREDRAFYEGGGG